MLGRNIGRISAKHAGCLVWSAICFRLCHCLSFWQVKHRRKSWPRELSSGMQPFPSRCLAVVIFLLTKNNIHYVVVQCQVYHCCLHYSPFTHPTLTQALHIYKMLSLTGLFLNDCKSFHSVRPNLYSSKKNLTNIHNTTPIILFIIAEHLTFSDQNLCISKSCYYHIRQLLCMCLSLDSSTACTIATSMVDSKVGYCNVLYYSLSNTQIAGLQ